jgi:hypothetical protein
MLEGVRHLTIVNDSTTLLPTPQCARDIKIVRPLLTSLVDNYYFKTTHATFANCTSLLVTMGGCLLPLTNFRGISTT